MGEFAGFDGYFRIPEHCGIFHNFNGAGVPFNGGECFLIRPF